MKQRIYLDHASTTYVNSRVLEKMLPYFSENFGNPSAIYKEGLEIREVVDSARAAIAKILNCMSEEVIFTASGTESDNMAVFGIGRIYNRPPLKSNFRHIITSSIEHRAVLEPCKHLEKNENFKISFLKPEQTGLISPKAIEESLTKETVLVSIMYANNEIGTINPISKIAKAIRDKKKQWGRKDNEPPFFHTDACQAAGALELDIKKLGIDLLTINGSKIYGPKGVGLLYLRRGLKLDPLIFGGGQEFKLRSGTENVAGIVGFAEALKLASEDREAESKRLVILRDKLISGIAKTIPKTVLNGHPTERLPNNVNMSILDIEGEAILLYLDSFGIAASTGSACDSSLLEPSHVILGIGRPYEYAHGSIRFTLGRKTTEKDIKYVLDVLPKIVATLRGLSPINLKIGDDKIFVDLGQPHWKKKK